MYFEVQRALFYRQAFCHYVSAARVWVLSPGWIRSSAPTTTPPAPTPPPHRTMSIIKILLLFQLHRQTASSDLPNVQMCYVMILKCMLWVCYSGTGSIIHWQRQFANDSQLANCCGLCQCPRRNEIRSAFGFVGVGRTDGVGDGGALLVKMNVWQCRIPQEMKWEKMNT